MREGALPFGAGLTFFGKGLFAGDDLIAVGSDELDDAFIPGGAELEDALESDV